MRTEVLGTLDLAECRRLPPLVFLIGCGTSAAGSTVGGFGASLMNEGCRLVVGTTYPVRIDVAVSFLEGLLRRIGLNRHRISGRHLDLATAVLLERRNIRFFSDLTGLVDSCRLPASKFGPLTERYVDAVGRAPDLPDLSQLIAIEARVLAKAGVIEDHSVPPCEWGIIPYPAFFSVLGMPWTTLTPFQEDDEA